MHEPRFPYFEWRLDRWKIGVALLLFAGLLFFRSGLNPTVLDSGVAPIAGQTPESGGGVAPDAAPVEAQNPPEEPIPSPELPPIELPTPGQPTLTLRVLGDPLPPLPNRTPLLYGETSLPDQPLEVRAGSQRLSTRSDGWGRWQIAVVEPLTPGQNWVRARIAPGAESGSGAMQSLIVTIAPDALAILPPLILPLLQSEDGIALPTLRGNGLPDAEIAIEGGIIGSVIERLAVIRAASDGRWEWTPPEPLEEGIYEFRAVHLTQDRRPITRSEPFRIRVDR